MSNSSEDLDILQEIPDEELPKLRDLYKNYWPHALHAYYWVDNYIDWKKRKISNVVFLSPEGKWDDGTFITIEDFHGSFFVFVFTLEKSCDKLRHALSTSKKLKWTNVDSILFQAIHGDIQPTIYQELERRKITVTHNDFGNLWWMSREESVKFEYEIPEDVYLSDLKPEDVDVIDPVWPHHSSFSRMYLLTLITHNGGFGLYLKSDNTLVAWVMRNNYGGMAILQTAEQHMRKGYAKILAQHFSKYWGERGLDMFCFIMKHNKASMSLFEKLGFRKEHDITWIHMDMKNSEISNHT